MATPINNNLHSNTIDNYSNSKNNLNKIDSNIINSYANSTNNLNTLNKVESNIINNNSNLDITLKEKLNNIDTKYDPNRTTINVIKDIIKDISSNISNVSEIFVTAGAEAATQGIKTGTNVVKMQGIAASNASADLAKTATDIAKTKLPDIMNNVKDVTKIVTEGVGEINNIIDTTTLETKEDLIKERIATMMALHPVLTEEQARIELEEEKRLEEEERLKKEETEKVKELELELEIEKAKAKADILETASEAKIVGATGGSAKESKKKTTLKNIQKGGKMSAKRTQKSIDDFLKPSITSSSVLRMIKGGKISIKKRKYNSGLRSKRRR